MAEKIPEKFYMMFLRIDESEQMIAYGTDVDMLLWHAKETAEIFDCSGTEYDDIIIRVYPAECEVNTNLKDWEDTISFFNDSYMTKDMELYHKYYGQDCDDEVVYLGLTLDKAFRVYLSVNGYNPHGFWQWANAGENAKLWKKWMTK